jgi:YegS/Rv2252/BmrU family lipid kinase
MASIPGRSLDTVRRSIKAKVIFNPASGRPDLSPAQLMELMTRLQAWRIVPEVTLVHPKSNLAAVAGDAIRRGIRLIIACGGDGTVDSVMGALVGTPATLGIIPTGTRNNVALSLGIPRNNVAEAVSLLRRGRRLRVDVGIAQSGRSFRYFLEAGTVGLISALYPAADDIQHGNLARIGDLLATLVAMPAAEIKLNLDGGREKIETQGHIVLVANMPYFGANFQVVPDISFTDGLLDVLVYSNLTKLELIGYAVQIAGGGAGDPRIRHYRVKSMVVRTVPQMPLMADGYFLGEGALKVSVRRHGLAVMAGAGALANLTRPEEPARESTIDG